MKNILFIVALFIFLSPFSTVFCYGVEETPQFSDSQKQLYLDGKLYLAFQERFDTVEEDGFLYVKDKENLFSAVITCDELDNSVLKLLREYYNDNSSTDDEMFEKFLAYRKSYFAALQNYYKRSFLYGSDIDSSESNMKIFGEYNETIYGQEAESVLFNTITSNEYETIEETYIYLSIPVPSLRSIYSVNFNLPKGSLDEKTLKAMNELIKAVHIPGLPEQIENLKVSEDNDAISLANKGIYPDQDSSNAEYTEFLDIQSGYKLSIPSVYIPYRNNGIIDSFDYKSFKINYNHFLSVTSEKLSNSSKAIDDNIEILKALHGENLSILEEGVAVIGDKAFCFVEYEIQNIKDSIHMLKYSIVKGERLYSFQLNSLYERPEEDLKAEFINILSSLEFSKDIPSVISEEQNFKKYDDEWGRYTFSYPDSWSMTNNTPHDEAYRVFSIENPELSGPINIQIVEGELVTQLSPSRALALVTGKDPSSLDQYFKKYSAPYIGKTSKLLACSYQIKNGSVYLYKLINYIDESERSKLCYSVDIIKGTNVYSLFISVSDYMTSQGEIINPNVAASLNFIAQSFDVIKIKDEETVFSGVKNWILSLNSRLRDMA